MIVVADTSVLINLCRVGQDHLLTQLFDQVVIPPDVAEEFSRLATAVSRFQGLLLPAGIRLQAPTTVPPQLQSARGLDPGEIAALALALEIHADVVLVDERRGYQVALAVGLTVMGVLGILLRAKETGLIARVGPLLDALQRDAQFWISEPLRQQVLKQANECP